MYKSISNVTHEANKSEKNGQDRIKKKKKKKGEREREDMTLRPSKQAQKDQDEAINRFSNLKKGERTRFAIANRIQFKERGGKDEVRTHTLCKNNKVPTLHIIATHT